MGLITGLTIKAVTLTDDGAHEIISTAANAGHTHGIGYWAEWHPAKHGVIREHNDSRKASDKGPWIALSSRRLAKGCALALEHGYKLNGDELDGPLADAVIQFAVFGVQKYG